MLRGICRSDAVNRGANRFHDLEFLELRNDMCYRHQRIQKLLVWQRLIRELRKDVAQPRTRVWPKIATQPSQRLNQFRQASQVLDTGFPVDRNHGNVMVCELCNRGTFTCLEELLQVNQ